MASFTLDDIRSAAEKKYGSVDIDLGNGETVRLINALQLPEAKRKQLLDVQMSASEEGTSQIDVLRQCIRLVAQHEHMADRLIEQVGDNLAILLEIFNSYNKDTELGEA